jgi:hypothetical protein
LDTPLTNPVLLEARPENGRPILVQVTPGQTAFVPLPAGGVALRTLTRDLLTFRPRVATARNLKTRTIGTVGGNNIVEQDDGSVTFSAGAMLQGCGANGQFGGLPCYAPASYRGGTLDILENAGRPGNWFGIVTDTGEVTGEPIVQGENDPCPGAYVSVTSLHLFDQNGNRLPNSSPFKYVDSATVPFIAVPPMVIRGVAGVVLGCRCAVTNTRTGQSVEAVVADIGPKQHLGEISVACAQAIGVPIGTIHPAMGEGAPSASIYYQLFPGTAAVVNGVTYPLEHS